MRRYVMLYIDRDSFDHHFIVYWANDEKDCLHQHGSYGYQWRMRPGNKACHWVIRPDQPDIVVGKLEMLEWVRVARERGREAP